MFPRHNGVAIILESFALNLIISVLLANKEIIMQAQTTFFSMISKIN